MAALSNVAAARWRNLHGDWIRKQLFVVLRALHKSAASEAFEVSGAAEKNMPERLMTARGVGQKTIAKTLKEMPGPSTLSNLVEFFWRDGFSRIHEIQVARLRWHRAAFAGGLVQLERNHFSVFGRDGEPAV